MGMRTIIIAFAVGLALGIAGTIYLPDAVRPYLPAYIAGPAPTVTGTVLAKQRKGNALLMTLNTPKGAVLVTVTKQADEVDLLVGDGDTVAIALKTYAPFIENPRITRVIKNEPAASSAPPEKPAEETGRHKKGAPAALKAGPTETGGVPPRPHSPEVSAPSGTAVAR